MAWHLPTPLAPLIAAVVSQFIAPLVAASSALVKVDVIVFLTIGQCLPNVKKVRWGLGGKGKWRNGTNEGLLFNFFNRGFLVLCISYFVDVISVVETKIIIMCPTLLDTGGHPHA